MFLAAVMRSGGGGGHVGTKVSVTVRALTQSRGRNRRIDIGVSIGIDCVIKICTDNSGDISLESMPEFPALPQSQGKRQFKLKLTRDTAGLINSLSFTEHIF